MCPVVIVQTVASQSSQQSNVLHFGYIGQIDTCCIALELDVEAELGLLNIRRQVIDVLHHQSPVLLLWIVAGILQRLHIQRLTGSRPVAGKLTHLIGLSAIGVLIGYCQHLVGLQTGLQRDISHGGIHLIF